MKLPTSISGWCMWLFFVWFGIGSFVALPAYALVAGVLALGYAVLSLFGQ